MQERQALVNADQYTKDQFVDARNAGWKLINAATTVDGVKEAYANAQALSLIHISHLNSPTTETVM